jgi:P-type Ca2+ transporter type 2C
MSGMAVETTLPAPIGQASSAGLSAAEAAARLKSDGYNELPRAQRRGVIRILFEVLRQPMFALLIAGGIVYLLLGDRMEAMLLLAFASLSVVITIVQESRSEKVLETLRNLASPRALVIRDGIRTQIAGRDVVRGDVFVITEGDRIAADATLVSAHDLLIDESLLTGESVAVRKMASANPQIDAARAVAGGEDSPYIFAGTLVVRGTALGLVHATGARSEMGKIGKDLWSIETEQPQLQRQMSWLIRDFAIVGAIAGGLAVVLFGLLRGSWLQAMLGGIALGMSLLPEEFPLVMTVFMAMGAWRISQVRVLTRRAAAIETLGATTVLCTDKTGTLTENRMTVVYLSNATGRWDRDPGGPLSGQMTDILHSALLASTREPTDPMDVAVHSMATGDGKYPGWLSAHSLIRAYGLRPALMAVANVVAGESDAGARTYAKGAPEAIAELCRLSAHQFAAIRMQMEELAGRGVRVLGVARSSIAAVTQGGLLPDSLRAFDFEYVGLIGFSDPLRSNVPSAVEQCRSAGIRVVMITGDYPATAAAIGRQAGLEATRVVCGDEIEIMSDASLATHVKSTSIFARIRPNQKLRIVQALKASGEIVAMTGDGVNDAPAIKAAHIGIAMGGRGTDVAREASAIVLLDDDFGSIVKTIRLGRRIYDNLRKAIEYIVAVHIPIAGIALLPLLLGLPLMLTPIHIAFLEMIIDPACSMVFEAEGEEPNVMRRPPRDPSSPLLLPRRILWALLQGLIALGILAGLFISASRMGMSEPDLRALVFTSLVLINMGLILVNRSFESSLVGAILKPNRALWMLLGGVSTLLGLAVFWQPAQALFHFGQPHWYALGACAAVGAACLIVLEALKSRWFHRATAEDNAAARRRQD